MTLFESLKQQITRRLGTTAPASDRDSQVSKEPEGNFLIGPGDLTSSGNVWSYVWERAKVARGRAEKYLEYDEMDRELPEFSSALDIYADNATRGDSGGDPEVTIRTKDPKVQKELDALVTRLNMKRMLWTLARDLSKYGERAEEVVVNAAFDIVRLKPLDTVNILPQPDTYGRLPEKKAYALVNTQGETVQTFHKWQVLFLANKKSRGDWFGTGLGFSIRRVFKLLRLMEESLVVARLTRAHNRFAFMLGTEGMTPKEKLEHLAKIKKGLKKPSLIDPRTRRLDVENNPMNVEQDLFLTTSKDAPSDVKVLQGDLTVGNLEDIEYFLQKILSGLKVPKAYLAHERDTKARAVITEQDIQFARSVRRLQFTLQEAFRDLCDLQLRLKGIDPATVEYTVALPPISTIDELRLWQTEQLKQLSARMFKTNFWASDEYILRTYLQLPEEEVQEILKGQKVPDAYNGLLGQPKVGAVPNNSAVGEAAFAAMEAFHQGDVGGFASAIEQLHGLLPDKAAA